MFFLSQKSFLKLICEWPFFHYKWPWQHSTKLFIFIFKLSFLNAFIFDINGLKVLLEGNNAINRNILGEKNNSLALRCRGTLLASQNQLIQCYGLGSSSIDFFVSATEEKYLFGPFLPNFLPDFLRGSGGVHKPVHVWNLCPGQEPSIIHRFHFFWTSCIYTNSWFRHLLRNKHYGSLLIKKKKLFLRHTIRIYIKSYVIRAQLWIMNGNVGVGTDNICQPLNASGSVVKCRTWYGTTRLQPRSITGNIIQEIFIVFCTD